MRADVSTIGDPDALVPPPAAPGVAEPIQPSASPQRRCVLVVDDSDDMRALLREVLESEGLEVLTASSSARALGIMRERTPDLVITDLMMPGMSGFSLRTLMLRQPALAAVPVIVLSAYWARPSETLEAVAVLPKPLNLDRLLEAVGRALPRWTV